jgi:GNAT superfamily N-acetyltransferase/RimJ/RimL family protein N-acetyltransferase
MSDILLRPVELEGDFRQLAAWFTILEGETSTELEIVKEYEELNERLLLKVAVDVQGELLGFYWACRDMVEPDRAYFYLFVQPEKRRQGVGRWLYEDLALAALGARIRKLRVTVWDNSPESRAFTDRLGFIERRHSIAMELDLGSFDDRPYDEVIARLEGEGFRFTSMEALGNTEEAQRKLYTLNDATAATIPGAEGEHSWTSFEDFQKRVCQSDWYKPGGQMVAIDTTNGAWAAMSAVIRRPGNDFAYNLFTGVDIPYRGRKIGQVVKVLALRYARDVLGAASVRTQHNVNNLPMIAIDRKLGYHQVPGNFLMEKILG